MSETPWYLKIYDEEYFAGHRIKSGYDDYTNCRGVLYRWAHMVEALCQPKSLLDVGCAYGFMIDYFEDREIPTLGVDPSDWALSQVNPVYQPNTLKASLPEIPDRAWTGPIKGQRFDVVTCTEVLEHVPEELVPASLTALAEATDRFLVMLIMLEGPGADGDEGHICLKSRDWWEWQLTKHTGFVQRTDLEDLLNNDPYSKYMYWSGRLFVRERQSVRSESAGDFRE